MDKKQILYNYNERIAICIFDGKLSEDRAREIAKQQLIEYYGEEVKDVFDPR